MNSLASANSAIKTTKIVSSTDTPHSESKQTSKSTLATWLLQPNIRIHNPKLLEALDQLGATEITDLLDLSEDDLLKFQPPFLKKLEFVRLQRGIKSLRHQEVVAISTDIAGNNIDATDIVTMTVHSNVAPHHNRCIIVENASSSDVTSHQSLQDHEAFYYERPPLPSKCPGKGCDGKLSLHLGTRKNKYLTHLKIKHMSDGSYPHGPEFRWIVTCSTCPKKWHACHFLCGHLQKISLLGSSDIIRHEQGRFNRWQKKIKPPCPKNPQSHILKAVYVEQRNDMKEIEERQLDKGKAAPMNDLTYAHENKHSRRDHSLPLSNSTVSVEGSTNNESSFSYPSSSSDNNMTIAIKNDPKNNNNNNPPQYLDNEFHSMLESLDKGTLNFHGFEGTDQVNTEFLTSTTNEGCCQGGGNVKEETAQELPCNIFGDEGESGPVNKKAKLSTEKETRDEEKEALLFEDAIEIENLCNEVNGKCRLSRATSYVIGLL